MRFGVPTRVIFLLPYTRFPEDSPPIRGHLYIKRDTNGNTPGGRCFSRLMFPWVLGGFVLKQKYNDLQLKKKKKKKNYYRVPCCTLR
jgi:hypothetical protein